jgi:hypothetical protein
MHRGLGVWAGVKDGAGVGVGMHDKRDFRNCRAAIADACGFALLWKDALA